MKLSRFLFLSVMAGATLFAQGGSTAAVRVVHASPDAPAVNVLVNGTRALEGIPYRGFTGYNNIPAGAVTLEIQVAPAGPIVLRETFTLMPGGNYTFLAIGRVSGGRNPLQLIGLGDDRTFEMGQAKLRVIHAAPSAPSVDVWATAPYVALGGVAPLLTNVPFGAASGFVAVPQGLYQARVAPTGTRNIVIDSGAVNLTGNTISLAIALDPEREGGPFQLLFITSPF